jgi:hypothetical protein
MNRIGIAFCVVLFAAPASAQEGRGPDFRDGYRKGYDDGFASGYKRGLEEMGRTMAPAAPRLGPIAISSAIYGTPSRNCNATHKVARAMNGRMSGSIDVTNDLCGDPARGERKSLEIAYLCGAVAKTASAFEHRSAYLDCSN